MKIRFYPTIVQLRSKRSNLFPLTIQLRTSVKFGKSQYVIFRKGLSWSNIKVQKSFKEQVIPFIWIAQNSHHSILSLDKNIRNNKTKFYFIHYAFINI